MQTSILYMGDFKEKTTSKCKLVYYTWEPQKGKNYK